MTYSGRKFNIFIIGMVLVIALIFGLNMYFGAVGGNSNAEVDSNEPAQEDPVTPPDIPSDDKGNTPSKPVFSNGMDAVMYALDKLKTGMDFKCIYSSSFVSGGVGQVDMIITKYRHKNHDILSGYSTSSLNVIDIGKFYEATYTNGKQTIVRQTTNYNYQSKTHNFTKNDKIEGELPTTFEYNDLRSDYNNFHINFERNMGRVGYFNKSNKDTYEIKIILNQKYLNDLQYTKNMMGRGVSDVNMSKLNITFTIDKKTGYLLKAVTDEVFSVKLPVIGYVNCTCQCKCLYTYMQDAKSEVLNFVSQEFGLTLQG